MVQLTDSQNQAKIQHEAQYVHGKGIANSIQWRKAYKTGMVLRPKQAIARALILSADSESYQARRVKEFERQYRLKYGFESGIGLELQSFAPKKLKGNYTEVLPVKYAPSAEIEVKAGFSGLEVSCPHLIGWIESKPCMFGTLNACICGFQWITSYIEELRITRGISRLFGEIAGEIQADSALEGFNELPKDGFAKIRAVQTHSYEIQDDYKEILPIEVIRTLKGANGGA